MDLAVDFRFVGAVQEIVNADVVKFCQPQKCFGWRNSLSVLKFGQKRLFDSCLHLKGYLGVASAFSKLFQSVSHNIT